jgi:hypothetical protein
LKTQNEGRPIETPEDLLNELLPFVDGLRESITAVKMFSVTVKLL